MFPAIPLGEKPIVFITSGQVYLELFQATGDRPSTPPGGTGPDDPGWRHLAVKVDDGDATLRESDECPALGAFVHGWVLGAPAMDRLAIIGSFLSVTAATVVVAIGARCYMVPHPLDHEHPAPRAHRNQHE